VGGCIGKEKLGIGALRGVERSKGETNSSNPLGSIIFQT